MDRQLGIDLGHHQIFTMRDGREFDYDRPTEASKRRVSNLINGQWLQVKIHINRGFVMFDFPKERNG